MTLLLDVRNDASPSRARGGSSGLVPSRWHRFAGSGGRTGYAIRITLPSPATTAESGPVEPEDIAFWQQKMAFLRIPPAELQQFQGKFVMSHDGRIIDSDQSLAALTRRWTMNHARVRVYIARVGAQIEADIATPFLD